MKFFLDANVLIDLANESNDSATVEAHWRRVGYSNCALSAITVEELQRGVLTGPAAKKAYEVRKLKALLAQLRQIEFKPDAARRAAAVRVQIEGLKPVKGQRPPGVTDMLLAGHALALGRAVATADRGFSMVTGLTVNNWRV